MNRDAELETLRAEVSCAVLLEQHAPPWLLDKRESTRNCLKYRRGEGEIILVTHHGRGWWDPGSTAKGDVFSLVQHLQPGLNLGQVRKLLRPLAGLQPAFPEHLRKTTSHEAVVSVDVRWNRRHAPRSGSSCWRYLANERRLPEPVLRAAIGADVLREGPHASAWFGHRDHVGRLTGIEMRGPSFRGFSPGGDKSLFRLSGSSSTSLVVALRLVVAEAPIDALSLAAIEQLRADSLYVATAGGMGPETIRALERLLETLASTSGAVVVAATDADRAGDGYADRLQAMAESAGVRFERLRPSAKDWNDELKERGA